MTKHTHIALALLGGCSLGMLATSCDDQKAPDATKEEAPAVQVTPILQQEVTDSKEWFGYITGKNSTDILPHVTGFLVEQAYTNGASVKAGDVLFRIDPATFEAALAQAKANLQAAEATLAANTASRDQAKLDVERFTQLYNSHAISEKDYTDARQKLRAAEASVKAAQAMIEQQKAAVHKAQINLDYCEIRAPYDGIVGTSLVSIGDLVGPGTKMTNITSVNPVLAKFSVSGVSLMNGLRKYGDIQEAADNHKLTPPPVEVVLEDGSVFPHQGKLITMGSTVSENGKVDMEAEFPNPDSLLRDGMAVRVRMAVSKHETLLVPESAIRKVLRNDFVIVVDPQNIPHTIPVNVEGEYEVATEFGPRPYIAISGYKGSLADTLKGLGFAKPTDARVVADTENGVRAMNISAANSRLAKGGEKGTITPVALSNAPVLPAAFRAAAEQAASGKKPPLNTNVKPTFPPVPVKVVPLLQQDVEVDSEWFGTLRGEQETDIRPQISGFLLSRNFENGSTVKKGEVLYEIDPAPFQAALEEAKANLLAAEAAKEQTEAQLEMYRNDLKRIERLRATDSAAISEKTLTDTKTLLATTEAAVRKAEATVAQMKAIVQMAEINLGYTTIHAPFDGRIGISNPSIGALVSPSDRQPMVRLSSMDPMRVDFNVSGKGALKGIAEFHEAHAEGAESVGPEFEIILEDGSIYPAKGKVVSADNALSRTTGTLQIVGQVENVDGGLRPGMPVRVRAGMDAQKGSYLVPARAPLNAQGMDMLVLVGPDNSPQMLPVKLGDIVNIPVTGPDGKAVVQPMQIVDANRELMGGLVLYMAKGAPTLEAVVLGAAGVKDWGALLLKQSGAKDFRELLEKQAGKALPDTTPADAGVEDWGALLLKQAGAKDFRSLILARAGAKDELDLIAQGKGFKDAMHMALAQAGITDPTKGCVVAEGSLMAAQIMAANMKDNTNVNKVKPVPFQYTRPQPVVGSVTAEEDVPPEINTVPEEQKKANK